MFISLGIPNRVGGGLVWRGGVVKGGGGLADAWDRGFLLQLVIVALYSCFVIQVWGSFIITEIYVVET